MFGVEEEGGDVGHGLGEERGGTLDVWGCWVQPGDDACDAVVDGKDAFDEEFVAGRDAVPEESGGSALSVSTRVK
jgi:hypothetical protein